MQSPLNSSKYSSMAFWPERSPAAESANRPSPAASASAARRSPSSTSRNTYANKAAGKTYSEMMRSSGRELPARRPGTAGCGRCSRGSRRARRRPRRRARRRSTDRRPPAGAGWSQCAARRRHQRRGREHDQGDAAERRKSRLGLAVDVHGHGVQDADLLDLARVVRDVGVAAHVVGRPGEARASVRAPPPRRARKSRQGQCVSRSRIDRHAWRWITPRCHVVIAGCSDVNANPHNDGADGRASPRGRASSGSTAPGSCAAR